jgi:hypothetical protein
MPIGFDTPGWSGMIDELSETNDNGCLEAYRPKSPLHHTHCLHEDVMRCGFGQVGLE